MPCVHESNKKDWMKTQNGIIKLHPYCNKCGSVGNISSDRGKKIGYFLIALSRLRKILKDRGYKVSEAQIRLIAKELSSIEDFDDTWWITFSRQKEIFISVVRKYIRVSTDLLESVLNSEWR
ncbi:hypothetical protein Asulf_00018 [Archaeoglobus sulfaticallidus PM70-1]|uniref:Uncharacterized protein n=1 Tax=Archaeoglobus sulfaticallidus PM70-1 TaxID=387631 RepID=N0B8X1_9EURY|nr:hypothetical protein [Archaeoglobus sulfaticallidus]AGK60054.1 hypothetical protein Asulf_00018 [Archaeoglobus sulfaticallidus PM70-1]